MGFQDRDYYREDFNSDSQQQQPKSAVFIIVVLNVAIWLGNSLFFEGAAPVRPGEPPAQSLTDRMALRPTDLTQPLQYYRFLTYGFAHASNFNHVLCNMLTLFFLGPLVEQRYSRKEFLWFYLISIIVGGLFWAITTNISLYSQFSAEEIRMAIQQVGYAGPQVVGASGAVSAVVILFAFNFPQVKLLLFFFIPMPAWLLGLLIVGYDFVGSMDSASNIAHSVHLAGAAFALLYYVTNFSFTGLFQGRPFSAQKIGNFYDGSFSQGSSGGFRQRSTYRDEDYEDDGSDGYYTPPPLPKTEAELKAEREFQQLEQEVEALLRKISQYGMQSLTPAEREKLNKASQIYRNRR